MRYAVEAYKARKLVNESRALVGRLVKDGRARALRLAFSAYERTLRRGSKLGAVVAGQMAKDALAA